MKTRLHFFPLALTTLIAARLSSSAQSWVPANLPHQQWQAIACSADAKTLIAAALNGGVYVSTNSGNAWFAAEVPAGLAWYTVSASSDGTKLLAAVYGGLICVSTNSGAVWTTNGDLAATWTSAAMSSDGTKILLGGFDGTLMNSTDSGATFTNYPGTPNNLWSGVASSANGSNLVAVAGGGQQPGPIYVSTNAGQSWTLSGAPSQKWQCVASSASGARLCAGVWGGVIYTSANSAVTWNPSGSPSAYWRGISSSSDGSKLAAVDATSTGLIYLSTNAGSLWTTSSVPALSWSFIASSADGTRLAATSVFGSVYLFGLSGPTLTITRSGANVVLSWPASATTFHLQQSPGIAPTVWAPVTNVPADAGGSSQVTLPASGRTFFRLNGS